MNGSQAIVRILEQAGVEVVFGLCGDTTLPLYEALYDLNPSFKHILTRDERSAAYMADAYARLSGRVGVCEGPSGGGVTYLLPGVVEANQSSVPLLALTSDIDLSQVGRGTLTELDQDALYRSVTTWTKTPTQAKELPWVLRRAFREAVSGRMGAVHVSLPLNVQNGPVEEGEVHIDPRYSRYPAARTGPEPGPLKAAAGLLSESRRPVIVAGAGVIRSQAWEELEGLAGLLGAPVATSISGKGALAETHPLSLGVIGSNGGLAYRHEFIRAADLVLYLGCHTGSVTTEKWSLPADGSTKIIQLDVDPARLGLNYRLAQGIVADAKLGLTALNQEVSDLLAGRPAGKMDPEQIARKRKDHLAKVEEFASEEIPIRPERFVAELSRALPDDAVIITDPGTPTPYLAAYHRLPQAGRWFVAPRAHGALGYALPAVVGGHLARPRSKVVGLMGDGSFGLSAGELETIVRLKAPVLLIVLTNGCYGWVKAGQEAAGGKYFGVDFSLTDHAAVARAYGLASARVESPGELKGALAQALTWPGPFLLDVVVQPLNEAKAPVSKWIA